MSKKATKKAGPVAVPAKPAPKPATTPAPVTPAVPVSAKGSAAARKAWETRRAAGWVHPYTAAKQLTAKKAEQAVKSPSKAVAAAGQKILQKGRKGKAA